MYRHDGHTTVWRLIDTGSHSGKENMAIDEALFRCFDPASSQPVLRLYGWQPVALSLGRFQKASDDLELERCAADDLTVVRRITGGGAIYHADELTYSLVCSPEQIPAAASVKESFRVLTSFLLDFYRVLGLQADYAVDSAPAGSRLGQRTPLCFAGQERYDIMVSGRKIGGNAQRRSRQVIFQHGSIPLADRVADGLVYLKQQPEQMAVTSLRREGIAMDEVSLKFLLLQQFAEQLGVLLVSDGLTQQETALAAQLAVTTYQNQQWNLKGIAV